MLIQIQCQTQEMFAQTHELEAHDKVLDNSRSNWNLEIGISSTCRGAKDDEDAVKLSTLWVFW